MIGRASSILGTLLGAKSAGFLTLQETEEFCYVGSILITDFNGLPVEFRCTHSLNPNAVQRSLYGESLLPYIGVEVCGRPLLRSVKRNPRVIFVDKHYLMGLDRYARCPAVYVRELEDGAGEKRGVDGEWGPEYRSEVVKGGYEGDKALELVSVGGVKDETRELIERLYSEFNLLEAFQRMERAVESLNKLSSRFK